MASDKDTVDDSLFHPETFKRAAGYKVVAPMVNLVTATPQGYRMLAFHVGSPVPADVSDEAVYYHLRDKLIAEVEDPAPEPADPQVEADRLKAEQQARDDDAAKAATEAAKPGAGGTLPGTVKPAVAKPAGPRTGPAK